MASARRRTRDPSERLAKRLLAEGRITQNAFQQTMQRRSATGARFEECLIELGLPEETLLKQLAELYRCKYITSQRLEGATIANPLLKLIPQQTAEQHQVVPLILDRKNSILSIVTANPDDVETMKEIEIASQVRTIRPLIARPAAVKAAVAKFYNGDDFAFAVLRNESYDVAAAIDRDPIAQIHGTPNTTAPAQRSESSRPSGIPPVRHPSSMPPSGLVAQTPYIAQEQSLPPSPAVTNPPRAPNASARPQRASGHPRAPVVTNPPGSAQPLQQSANVIVSSPPAPAGVGLTPPPPPPEQAAAYGALKVEGSPLPPSIAPEPSADQSGPRVAPRLSTPAKEQPSPEPKEAAPERQTQPGAKLESIGEPFQLAVVLVSLLEGNRRDLRGHSVQTARLVRKVCERFNVPGSRARAAEVGALVHDLGKASSYHLTPFNVAQFEGHQAAARKLYATPARVLESARLAKATTTTVTHMYERYDGEGFPAQLRAADIPLESRILAICDSFTDLTSNPRNSFRKVLTAQEACEALREHQGTVFDPKVIDRFSPVVLGDELAQQLRSDRGAVLLVDPDVEETTVLELALIEQRYVVHIARAADEALDYIEGGQEVDIVVSEVALQSGTGFELMEKIREKPNAEGVGSVFFSQDTDSDTVSRALDAGAADYLFKPLSSQIVVAKVRHILEQSQKRARGVSGSLEEMSLPDIVQVLSQGRKSCALRLSGGGEIGDIHFRDGSIVDARWGAQRGADAFYAMVHVARGDFTVDPEAPTPEQTIETSTEMLLLEGMRRLDESNK